MLNKIFYLVAVGLAAFQDLAAGAAFAAILGSMSHTPLEWWHIAGGALLSVLPDFDIVPSIVRRVFGANAPDFNHHESVFHWPTFMMPVVTVVAWDIAGSYWGILAFFGLFFHYLHDMSNMAPEDRIRWFFRLRPKFWSAENREDPTQVPNDLWFKMFWMRPSTLAAREILLGSLFVGVATFLLTFDVITVFGAMIAVWVFVWGYWLAAANPNKI
jgi:hypothetical protein